MDNTGEILIVEGEEATRNALAAYIAEHARYAPLCRVCAPEIAEKTDTGTVRIYLLAAGAIEPEGEALCLFKPVRLGSVLDAVESILKIRDRQAQPQKMPFQGWELDTLYNVLQSKDSKDVRLTEKEKEILVILHEHNGESVPREALLERVWSYAEGVETHTLETHIYRLRQKIEADPAAPEILLTTDAGYQLRV